MPDYFVGRLLCCAELGVVGGEHLLREARLDVIGIGGYLRHLDVLSEALNLVYIALQHHGAARALRARARRHRRGRIREDREHEELSWVLR